MNHVHGAPRCLEPIPMMPALIEYRPYGLGSLVAFVSIAFPNAREVHNITYFENSNSRRWVQPPVDVYTKDSGEMAYLPILELASADDYKAFQTQVHDAIDRYRRIGTPIPRSSK